MSRYISIFIMFCCIAIAGQSVLGPRVKTHCNILNWMLLCNHWSVGPRSPCKDTLQHIELNVALQWLVCRSPVPMPRHITTFWIDCCIAMTGLSVSGPHAKTHYNILNWMLHCNYWSVGLWSPCQDTLQHFEFNAALHYNYLSVGLRSPRQDTLQYFELNSALQSLVCRSPVPMPRHIATFGIECCIKTTGL
jgi:hypothetical protein